MCIVGVQYTHPPKNVNLSAPPSPPPPVKMTARSWDYEFLRGFLAHSKWNPGGERKWGQWWPEASFIARGACLLHATPHTYTTLSNNIHMCTCPYTVQYTYGHKEKSKERLGGNTRALCRFERIELCTELIGLSYVLSWKDSAFCSLEWIELCAQLKERVL